MKGKFQARDRILPLIHRPFALQDKFEDVVRLKKIARECLLVAVRVHLRNGHGEILHTQTAEQTRQFAAKAFAEEYVQITLRSRIANQQEFSEFVQVLKDPIVKRDVNVLMRIVGEEGSERDRRHHAEQVDRDNNHQHVG